MTSHYLNRLWLYLCALEHNLTMPQSFSASSTPTYSKKLAKPSFSHRSSHQSMVTMLPNHCRNKQQTQHKKYERNMKLSYWVENNLCHFNLHI